MTKDERKVLAMELASAINDKYGQYVDGCGHDFAEKASVEWCGEHTAEVVVKGNDGVMCVDIIVDAVREFKKKHSLPLVCIQAIADNDTPMISVLF